VTGAVPAVGRFRRESKPSGEWFVADVAHGPRTYRLSIVRAASFQWSAYLTGPEGHVLADTITRVLLNQRPARRPSVEAAKRWAGSIAGDLIATASKGGRR
jgi:hypothetical protein